MPTHEITFAASHPLHLFANWLTSSAREIVAGAIVTGASCARCDGDGETLQRCVVASRTTFKGKKRPGGRLELTELDRRNILPRHIG
jgi:pyridoxine/pyridoxamine 5'-phosphate oxidase